MTGTRRWIVPLLALSLALAAPASAAAQDDGDVGTIVKSRVPDSKPLKVRNKFFYKRKRLEITPQIAWVSNNPLNDEVLGGVFLTYHFSERVGLELNVSYGFLGGTQNTKPLALAVLRLLEDSYRLESVDTGLMSMVSLVLYPMYGKLNPFGLAVLNLDFYFVLGIGYGNEFIEMLSRTVTTDASGIQHEEAQLAIQPPQVNHLPMANLAFGAEFYASKWFSLRLEGRVYVTVDQVLDYATDEAAKHNRQQGNDINRLSCHSNGPNAADVMCATTFPSTFVLGLGGSFWLPGQKAANQSRNR